MEKSCPDYKKIYTDIILKKHPEKYSLCIPILQEEDLSILNIITLNHMIFGFEDQKTTQFNQKHRSYDESAILEILEYQKSNGYSNIQVGKQFKISRNTIAKWKKHFNKSVEINKYIEIV
ncbi:helix-turn-helix domain-containing protein [Chryseobacterium antibioticum]|uniref:Helix-turn-helix domain-containing protein n=1 Tax=Chryseobacterium pyrolae TaxID=2987481 RepID=A0ABT2IC77_9FLAO|nr:helix-turn-helix domain-containing protein [Chryseobacterium pyrolae]MCT2406235.1 helix-turn-helix domain-containing protein [Chryseobacterium pyrolae]